MSTETLEAAKLYLEKSKNRSTWEQFLHGVAATHEFSSLTEKKILEALKRVTPTPAEARRKCPIPKQVVPDSMNKSTVVKAVCENAEKWEKIEELIKKCDLPKLAEEAAGLGYKGADMVGILAGCNTVVVDKVMIKKFWKQADDDDVRRIQTSKILYYDFKRYLEKHAEEEGLPYNIWHVKEWLEDAEAPKRVGAKKWVEELFE